MPGKLARRTKNLIRKTVGMVNRSPRILNVESSLEIIGYIDVNDNATTPFSRGKVHKGFFCCERDGVQNGDLLLDRADGYHYFAMDSKAKISNGEVVFVDATMYRCDKTITIQRFSTGERDTFGRPKDAAPTTVATDVFAMFNPKNYDVSQQKDRVVAQDKITMCVQRKVGVAVSDRIVTSDGNTYVIYSIDRESLIGLDLCTVDADER